MTRIAITFAFLLTAAAAFASPSWLAGGVSFGITRYDKSTKKYVKVANYGRTRCFRFDPKNNALRDCYFEHGHQKYKCANADEEGIFKFPTTNFTGTVWVFVNYSVRNAIEGRVVLSDSVSEVSYANSDQCEVIKVAEFTNGAMTKNDFGVCCMNVYSSKDITSKELCAPRNPVCFIAQYPTGIDQEKYDREDRWRMDAIFESVHQNPTVLMLSRYATDTPTINRNIDVLMPMADMFCIYLGTHGEYLPTQDMTALTVYNADPNNASASENYYTFQLWNQMARGIYSNKKVVAFFDACQTGRAFAKPTYPVLPDLPFKTFWLSACDTNQVTHVKQMLYKLHKDVMKPKGYTGATYRDVVTNMCDVPHVNFGSYDWSIEQKIKNRTKYPNQWMKVGGTNFFFYTHKYGTYNNFNLDAPIFK